MAGSKEQLITRINTMSKKNKAIKNTRESKSLVILFTVMILILSVLLSVFAWWQIHNYELGVAELYAEEQDGYVELVARQIELYGDIAGDSFVEDTIDLLDSTSRRYWTLDNSEYFLFVKSISETNTYKSFSTDTFYNTTSAQDFLGMLVKGQAKHAIITIDEDKYVASGIIFTYDGTSYRMCLLTDYDVMLTNNEYLSSKLYLLIDFIFLIAVLIIAVILFVIKISQEKKNTAREKMVSVKLGKYVDYLDNVIMGRNTSLIVTGEGKIDKLIHEVDARSIYPMAFVRLNVPQELMLECFDRLSGHIGKDVVWLRFRKDAYILLASGRTAETLAADIKSSGIDTGAEIKPIGTCDGRISAMELYNRAVKE